ncbi:MBOAT family protein [Leptospira sp. 201903071]|uniref:MBOAT family O-acyltransferase n=1 Tax=Leptospira ainazelensis TaxID=2810034 RepID=UPI001964B60E|nr:MBOAT family protein [Leptospira ainazelensis]MBM9499643.1 MBOAT family protein [Leptospira ainazelensis]
MLFVSYQFFIFFTFVYLTYWTIPSKYRMYFLLASSLVFYGSWSFAFLLHFLFILVLNYYLWNLYRINRNQTLFFIIQCLNLSNLAFFKYFYFLADLISVPLRNPAWLEQNLRHSHNEMGFEILLPLAISFYTFQIMSYGFDLKNGIYVRKHSLAEFLLFISFFPQLIAGPIVRSQDLLPQIQSLREGTLPIPITSNVKNGLWLLLSGVIKKIFIANQLLLNIQPLLLPDSPSVFEIKPASLWILSISFLVMLYADFSGYSDIARGLGKLLGFELPINFKAPFFFSSFSDLWKRWHLTFSSWIRDYIFIPLGGSRVSETRLWFNLCFTFFLGGLWHGAKIPFAVWGLCMGVFLSVEVFLSKRGMYEWNGVPAKIFKRILIWILYLSSGVFFFAPDWQWGKNAIIRMFFFNGDYFSGAEIVKYSSFFLAVVATFFFQIIEEYPNVLNPFKKREVWLLPLTVVLVVFGLTQIPSGSQDFFYFQF